MGKLINNVMKLIMCAVIFCGTNFGMEKEDRKPQERRLQQRRVKNQKDDDVFGERCLESCGNCCLTAIFPICSAVVLTAIRGMQDDIFIESYRAFFTNKST